MFLNLLSNVVCQVWLNYSDKMTGDLSFSSVQASEQLHVAAINHSVSTPGFFSPLWSLTLHPIHSSSLLPRSASRSLLERSSPRNTILPNPTRSYHHFTLETCKSLLHQKLKLKVAIVLKITELSHTSWLNFFKTSNLKASILSLKEIFS